MCTNGRWLRHHIGDGSDGGKSFGGSSTSRGVKKKLETAESFARMNHLSDSMPSLVIQASIPEAPSVTSSSGAEGTATADGNASSSASTMASSQSGDIVVNYRLRKSVVSSTTNEDRFGNEDRYGMNGTR